MIWTGQSIISVQDTQCMWKGRWGGGDLGISAVFKGQCKGSCDMQLTGEKKD